MLKIKQIYILILERWYGNKWEEVMVTLFQVKFIMIFIYCMYCIWKVILKYICYPFQIINNDVSMMRRLKIKKQKC